MRRKMTWVARWIWSKGATRHPFHISYFSKEFEMGKAEGKARVHCAADSKYRLWVNGEYIGFGPARGHSGHPYYDTHVVPLKAGRNTIAFLVQHYTKKTPVFASVEGGLICEVEAEAGIVAATDSSWRALASKAYSGTPGIIFPEIFDARFEPDGWQRPEFDAHRWPAARVLSRSKLAAPRNLIPRPIPLIKEKRLAPARLLDTWRCQGIRPRMYAVEQGIPGSLREVQQERLKTRPSGKASHISCALPTRPLTLDLGVRQAVCLILDFGKETLASTEIVARGPAGVIVDLGYAESLDDDLVSVSVSERVVLKNGRTHHRMIQARGFRFMILRVSNIGRPRCRVSLEDVAAYESIYPTKSVGHFACSDSLLNRIFGLSARTIKLCMEDSFTDCPLRERTLWLGDLQPEALFGYYAFGEFTLAKKCVLEFAGANRAAGWVPSVFPSPVAWNLPTWSMRFPVIAWEYYLYSGDRPSLPALYESVKKEMVWLGRYESRKGLLVNLGLLPNKAANLTDTMHGMNFVDWTKLDVFSNDGVVQGWYLEALDCSAKLACAAGDRRSATDFATRAARLRKSLAKCYWSERRKAFLKYRPDSPQRPPHVRDNLIGQHENFLFALRRVGTAEQRQWALRAAGGATGRYLPALGDDYRHGNAANEDLIRIGSPFWSFYALLALMEAGKDREALEYIRLCWGLMLDYGATSCWEMWDRRSSLCHGWSAAPAMILPRYVLGVAPLMPGFRVFEVHPRVADLAWARGRVPTPYGTITVGWKTEDDRLILALKVPNHTSARVCPPTGGHARWHLARVDGKACPSVRTVVLDQGLHEVVFDINSATPRHPRP
ncbi:MAG: alpha-L-rhamnosidase C-terminal domain-containing protein [Planctomycetota bacterium]